MNLMSCLSESGVLVSYGATSRKAMVVQPGSLIFKEQIIRGFSLLYWYQSATPDEIGAMFDHLAPLIAAGAISPRLPPPTVSTRLRKQSQKPHRAETRCFSRRKRD
jgi:NADPH:quinone reductase-like Zn-dependent oxidoreductase